MVLIDSVGVEAAAAPMPDFFALDPRGVVEASFHDPDLRALAGDPYMHDPGLPERLAQVRVPVLAIYGGSDGITTPAYGRALAALLPDARFEEIAAVGHLPHLEQPAATFAAIDDFLAVRLPF